MEIASIPHGHHTTTFNGNISAVVVTLDGISRSCDLSGLDWLDGSQHIGVSTAVRRGNPVCTLENMDDTVMMSDIFAQMPGNQCVYMSDQRGQSGMVCSQP